jgi:hypothetical protein
MLLFEADGNRQAQTSVENALLGFIATHVHITKAQGDQLDSQCFIPETVFLTERSTQHIRRMTHYASTWRHRSVSTCRHCSSPAASLLSAAACITRLLSAR